MLERLRLRNDVVARLVAANTIAGSSVTKDHVDPLAEDECPALGVYTLDENGENETEGRLPIFKSEITLQIDASVAATADWGDRLDNLCEEVEEALLRSPEFLSEFERVTSYRTKITQRPGGEVTVAIASMQIGLIYSNAFEPVVPDAFTNVGIKVDAINPHDANLGDAGPDGVLEGELELELEQ